jgi:hypothetical protein
MDALKWIDKKLPEIKETLEYGKYFDSILVEKGTEVLYLFNRKLGIDMILRENSSVKAIHFYSGTQNGTSRFQDKLPYDLNFSFSRESSRALLGWPEFTGGGEYSMLYGITPYWDKYVFEKNYLHLQFSKDFKQIDLITIFSLNDN